MAEKRGINLKAIFLISLITISLFAVGIYFATANSMDFTDTSLNYFYSFNHPATIADNSTIVALYHFDKVSECEQSGGLIVNGACWITAGANQDCDAAATAIGTTAVAAPFNDSSTCEAGLAFFPTYSCYGGDTNTFAPYCDGSYNCYYNDGTNPEENNATTPNTRLCQVSLSTTVSNNGLSDSSGNGNDITLASGAKTDARVGYYNFGTGGLSVGDGMIVQGYATVGNDASINLQGNISISLWYNGLGAAQLGGLFGSTTNGGYQFYVDDMGYINFGNGTNYIDTMGTPTAQVSCASGWCQFGVVYDADNKQVKFYKNGANVTDWIADDLTFDTGHTYQIGKAYGYGFYTTGAIDELVVQDAILQDCQMQEYYKKGADYNLINGGTASTTANSYKAGNGIIGGGRSFSTSQYNYVGSAEQVNVTKWNAMTIGAWARWEHNSSLDGCGYGYYNTAPPSSFVVGLYKPQGDSNGMLPESIQVGKADCANESSYWVRCNFNNETGMISQYQNSIEVTASGLDNIYNQLHYYSCTADFNLGTATLYIDGVSVASQTIYGTKFGDGKSGFMIGAVPGQAFNAHPGFKGLIDQVSVYNKSLSEAEIIALMNVTDVSSAYGICQVPSPPASQNATEPAIILTGLTPYSVSSLNIANLSLEYSSADVDSVWYDDGLSGVNATYTAPIEIVYPDGNYNLFLYLNYTNGTLITQVNPIEVNSLYGQAPDQNITDDLVVTEEISE